MTRPKAILSGDSEVQLNLREPVNLFEWSQKEAVITSGLNQLVHRHVHRDVPVVRGRAWLWNPTVETDLMELDMYFVGTP